METAFFRLRPLKVGGHTHLRVDRFKRWLREAYSRENLKTSPLTELWMCLVEIIQHMWRTGDIPQELGLTVFVLMPKGTTDTRVIVLLYTDPLEGGRGFHRHLYVHKSPVP